MSEQVRRNIESVVFSGSHFRDVICMKFKNRMWKMTRFNERTRLGALLRGTEKRNKPEIKRFWSDDNIPEQEPCVNIEKSIKVKRQRGKTSQPSSNLCSTHNSQVLNKNKIFIHTSLFLNLIFFKSDDKKQSLKYLYHCQKGILSETKYSRHRKTFHPLN